MLPRSAPSSRRAFWHPPTPTLEPKVPCFFFLYFANSLLAAAAELLVNSYLRSFRFPAIITRSNNVYGPHQFPDKVVPKFICQLMRGQPCTIHGDGLNSRHYLFIDDVIAALDRVVHCGEIGAIYNIGSDDELRNIDLARTIMSLFGIQDVAEQNALIKFGEDRSFNDARYVINSDRIKALGWEQKVPFDQGIKRTSTRARSSALYVSANVRHRSRVVPREQRARLEPH